MLFKWPHILDGQPVFTRNGRYIAYVINDQPRNGNTLVVKSIKDSWRTEIINAEEYFFGLDNAKLHWKRSDTLYSIVLGREKVDYICPITSLKLPRYSKGEWIAFLLKDDPGKLVIRNLLTGKEFRLDNVLDYVFNDVGKILLVKRGAKKNGDTRTSLHCIYLPDGRLIDIWSAEDRQESNDYIFDASGDQLSFIVKEHSSDIYSNSIWYYKTGMNKAIAKVTNQSSYLQDQSLVITGTAQFSGNGKWLFFEVKVLEQEQKMQSGTVQVDIWSYKDRVLFPNQHTNIVRERQAAVAVVNSEYIYVSGKDEQLENFYPAIITGDFIVVRNNKDAPPWWQLLPPPTYWLIALKDGARTVIKKESKDPVWNFSFSPGGRYLLYWDAGLSAYICHDTQTGRSRNITAAIPEVSKEPDYVGGMHSNYPQPVAQPAGWVGEDNSILIYDRYDIWSLDMAGKLAPENITNGYGAKHHIKLRLVYPDDGSGRPIRHSGKDDLLLTGFNTLNKHNGFFKKNLAQKGDPILLTMGPYTYYLDESQKPHEYTFGDGMQPVKGGTGKDQVWAIQRSSATDFPNYYLSNDLIHYRPLTSLQPQEDYNWLTAELIIWEQLDGSMSQGILYKPENFDPQKRYPVIFNYYKMLSHRLHGFPWPGLTDANIDIPWFVSRGYLVFTPDIHFSTASDKGGKIPGEAAYNAIESAARYLSKIPYINAEKMALQGHSFGGGLTNYLITRSNRFAAACSAAGTVSDQISAYLGLTRPTNMPPHEYRLNSSERGLDRLGATLWERPDLYMQASPVFKADQVTTPLLIMHNQGDPACDWGQSAELYMALRRLGKKVWMLQYDNEDHALKYRKNATDFTIRITQFFDHYLKDEPPAEWMITEGQTDE